MASRTETERPVSVQCAQTEVELSAGCEAAWQLLGELKRLYLQLDEAGRAKVRVQLNQLRQQ